MTFSVEHLMALTALIAELRMQLDEQRLQIIQLQEQLAAAQAQPPTEK